MFTKKKWMILDSYLYHTLSCVRSFGKHGIDFVVGGKTKYDMSFYSKYCKQKFVYTDPCVSISRFVNDLNNNIKKFKPDVIFPVSDEAILACSRSRDAIDAPLLIPSEEMINTVCNKRNVLELAKSIGISTPNSCYINKSNVHDMLCKIQSFPVIIKAESSVVIIEDRVVSTGGTSYVFSREQLSRECDKRLKISPLIVQKFIDGYGVGVSGIFKEGKHLALFGHKRVREKDPKGGPGVVIESIDIDNDLGSAACRLMDNIQYTGPAMVECKIDHLTKKPYLMEINARLWGSVLFPISIGLDFPYIWWKVANGLDVDEREVSYSTRVKGRYVLGDTKALYLTLKGMPKGWPGSFPRRLSTLKDYLCLFFDRNTKNLLFCKDDIGPFWGRIVSGFWEVVR